MHCSLTVLETHPFFTLCFLAEKVVILLVSIVVSSVMKSSLCYLFF